MFQRIIGRSLIVVIAAAGMPAFAQTVPLLRAPDAPRTDAGCAALLKRIAFLDSPDTRERLERSYYGVKRLEEHLAGDVRAADEALRKELWNYSKDEGKSLLKDLTKSGIKSNTVELMQAVRLHANSPSRLIRFRDEFVPAATDFLKHLSELEKVLKGLEAIHAELADQRYVQGLRDAARTARDVDAAERKLEAALRSYEQAQGERLKTAGELMAWVGGATTEALFKVLYLDMVLALNLFDTSDYRRSQLQEAALNMRDQLQKLELDRNIYQNQYRRDCKPGEEPARQAQHPGTTAPSSTPAATPSPAGGLGTALLAGGLAALAIAAGAAAGGSGGGGSSSCNSGYHACTPPNSGVCCPNGTTIYCTNNNTCTNLNAGTFGNLCGGNQSAASNCGQ